jgi:ABC-2 type transport system ATP-binding protein
VTTEAVITATAVHKRFSRKHAKSDVVALAGVDLTAPPGSLTGIVGPDGAGKTTLMRLTAGLLVADSGQLRVLGLDPAGQGQQVQARISYMPQRFGLYEDLTVQENLDLYTRLHGVSRDESGRRMPRLLQMTNLGEFTSRLAGKLSGGMKQKLALCCALVRSPELLLLDEPTVGVDPLSRRELWEILAQLIADERLTVVMTSAYMDEAEKCDHVLVMHEGKVLAAGPPADIKALADGLCYVATPVAGEPPRALQARMIDARGLIADAVPRAGEVHFLRQASADVAQLHELRMGSVETAAPTLEDGFMLLLQKHPSATSGETLLEPPPLRSIAARQAVIEVHDLVRKFGDFTAVANTSFTVQGGEIFGLLGPNGAGKTTTFRMLCGLLPASSGHLRVAGVDLRTARAQARRKIGYVSQKFALYGTLTVVENLVFYGGAYGIHGAALDRRIAQVLADFGLGGLERQPTGALPGGYKQRLAMAAAMLHEPEILFLDEPTSGADPLARRAFWRRITFLANAGVTIVVTTHFMEEAEYCDRILIQDAGHVLALGTPTEVRQQAGAAGGKVDMEHAFIAIVENARSRAATT